MTSYMEEMVTISNMEEQERIPFMVMQEMISLMQVTAGTRSSVEMAAIQSKSLMAVT